MTKPVSVTFSRYISKRGYEVKTAGDGVEGINYFKMYEPDLVLL